MSEDNEREVGWVLISPPVLAAKDLCMSEKVLLGRICGLIGKRGYCFASNEWLGEQLGFSDRTVEKYIAQLVRKCYLLRAYGKGGKRTRRLIPTIGGVHPYPRREDIPIGGGKHSVSETDVSDGDEEEHVSPPSDTALNDLENGTYSPEFEALWMHWRTMNRGVAKRKAARQWNETLNSRMNGAPIEESVARLIRAAANYRKVAQTERRTPDKILHAATFLGRDMQWTDYEQVDPSQFGKPERNEDRIRALRDDLAQVDRYLEYKIAARLAKLSHVANKTIEQADEEARLEDLQAEYEAKRAVLVAQLRKEET